MAKTTHKRFEVLQKVLSPLMDEEMMVSSLSGRENYYDKPYIEGRYLDAWARVLNIQAPCSAVCKVEGTLFVSFNRVERHANERALKIIEYCLLGAHPGAILFVSSVFNRNIIDEVNSKDSPYNKFFKMSQGKLLAALKEKQPAEAIETIVKSNIEEFFAIQKAIFSGDNLVLITVLLRLNQDIIKLNHFKYGSVKEIVLLDNPERLHGELVVRDKLAFPGAVQYIGISKLSCYLCDEILNYDRQAHRGTHGILYLNGFNIPELLPEALFKSVIGKINQHLKRHWIDAGERVVNNNRLIINRHKEEAELSDDEDIDRSVRLIDKFENCSTLYELKNSLSRRDDHDDEKEDYGSPALYQAKKDLGLESSSWITPKIIAVAGFLGTGAYVLYKILSSRSASGVSYKGQGSNEKDNSYDLPYSDWFNEYYSEGIETILLLRVKGLEEGLKERIEVLPARYQLGSMSTDISKVVQDIHRLEVKDNDVILVPYNIGNRHWVGIVFKKFNEGFKVTYLDPENGTIEPRLLLDLAKELGSRELELEFHQELVERQKYNNCGSEVIENFIYYLTGNRVESSRAVIYHSKLIEDSLTIDHLGKVYDGVMSQINFGSEKFLVNGADEIMVIGDISGDV